jgi:hypothetical protein
LAIEPDHRRVDAGRERAAPPLPHRGYRAMLLTVRSAPASQSAQMVRPQGERWAQRHGRTDRRRNESVTLVIRTSLASEIAGSGHRWPIVDESAARLARCSAVTTNSARRGLSISRDAQEDRNVRRANVVRNRPFRIG